MAERGGLVTQDGRMAVPGDLLVKVGHVEIIQDITAAEENGELKVKNYSDVKVNTFGKWNSGCMEKLAGS